MNKWIISIFILLIIASAVAVFATDLRNEIPSFRKASESQKFKGISQDGIVVVYNGEAFVNEGFKDEKDRLYVPIKMINEKIDSKFFYDIDEKVFTLTTMNQTIRTTLDSNVIKINNEPIEFSYKILLAKDKNILISLDFVKDYAPIQYAFYENPMRIVIDKRDEERKLADINKRKSYIRTKPTHKYPIIEDLSKGDTVTIFDEENDWYYVQTESGFLGYVQKKDVKNIRRFIPNKSALKSIRKNPAIRNKKINLVWHQVGGQAGNAGIKKLMTNTKGVNTLSPTWFDISDETGKLSNFASKEYVNWAHQQGYEVWALVSNQFKKDLTHEVLSYTSKREYVINQLIKYAKEYKFDGINVDFENVGKDDDENFLQFIRELSTKCYNEKLVLSVDVYVPQLWTAHYNRDEVAKVVDYIAVMAYDEHWSTSKESGSVASLGFVENGIEKTLKEVPRDKIILGLPFFTRLWNEKEVNGNIEVSSKAVDMTTAKETLLKNGAKIKWDEQVKQYYGEYTKDGIKTRCWLEETKSIEEKLKVYKNNQLAGTAGWKLGLEMEEVYGVINKYVK